MNANSFAFACTCGAVAGEVRPGDLREGRHYVCHCTDCQTFAQYCGHAETVLDRNAGTDILQLPASYVRLNRGRGALAAIHLTDRPLVRWHCAACRIPIANTLVSPKWSFFSMILVNAEARDAAAGRRPAKHVFVQSGCGDLSGVPRASMVSMGLPILKWMIEARLRGTYRDHPLFDPETLKPLTEPRRLTEEERDAAYRRAADYRKQLQAA